MNQADLSKVSNQFVNGLKYFEEKKDGWVVKAEKPGIIYGIEVDGRVVTKCSNTLNLPFEEVLNFFKDPMFIKKLNQNLKVFEILKDDKEFKVIHGVMEMPGPMSNREIVAVNTTKIEGNKAYCGNRSCNNYPFQKNPDTVLAEIHAGGFILERKGNQTQVIAISDVDVKGNIPAFVQNTMATKRVEMLMGLQKKIKEGK